MTGRELSALEALIGEFRAFRVDDSDWKESIDKRLRVSEEFVAGARAVAEREAARGVSRRAYIASIIAAVGILVSITLGFVNFVLDGGLAHL